MERLIPVFDKMVVVALLVFVAFSMFSISVTQIAAGVGGLAWLWRTHLTESWKDMYWPLWVPFGLYVLACLIAVAGAFDVSISYPPLKKLLEILIFFWVINCVRDNRFRDFLALFFIIAATIAGLLGLYQAWDAGITVESRVEGTLSTYMTLAGILMMVGLLALGRLQYKSPRETWLLPCIGIILMCLVFTLTRQAWFGFLMGLIFFLFIMEKEIFLDFSIFSFCGNYFLEETNEFRTFKNRDFGRVSICNKYEIQDTRNAEWQGPNV